MKKSPWRVGYFVAILENELILRFSGRFFEFLLKVYTFLPKSAFYVMPAKNISTKKVAIFDLIRGKSGYF